MWERPTVYAVKKDGNQRAKSLHDVLEDAEEEVKKLGKGYVLETRKGRRVRCEEYCQVAPYCDQYKSYLEENQ
jgi:hypothetical protein